MGDEFDVQGRLRVDFSELEEIPDRTEAAVAAADGQQIGIKTEVDDRQATASFRETDRAIARLDKAVARPKIEVDGSRADRTIADMKAQFASLNASTERLRASAAGTGLAGGGVANAAGGTVVAGRLASLGKVAPLAAAAAVPMAIMGARQLYSSTVPRALEGAKSEKAVTWYFGASQGQEFLAASEALAEATGFLARDFREAAMAGKSLAAMSDEPAKAARLQTEAIKQLLPVAADIAATSPDKALQSVAGAFTTMKAAIAGSAAAQHSLGVDLTDAYMQTQAFGGALRNTWADLSAAEQAQLRYKEMLVQTKDVMGEAGDETSLEFQMRSFNQQTGDLAEALGTELIPMMTGLITMINQLVDSIPDWAPKVVSKAVEYGWEAQKYGAMANPVTQLPASMLNLSAARGKAKNQGSLNLGAVSGAAGLPAYYPPAAPGPSAPAAVQVNLNVRREPGTTINLDGASYAPSNQ